MTDSQPAVDPEALDRLLEMTGGDREFLAELIETYVEDGGAQLANLRTAVATGDAEAAVRPAHSLKSNSASMGAEALSELCRSLETDARAGTIDDGQGRVDAASAEFERVCAALRAFKDRSWLRPAASWSSMTSGSTARSCARHFRGKVTRSSKRATGEKRLIAWPKAGSTSSCSTS